MANDYAENKYIIINNISHIWSSFYCSILGSFMLVLLPFNTPWSCFNYSSPFSQRLSSILASFFTEHAFNKKGRCLKSKTLKY